jgi:hypothetical protein
VRPLSRREVEIRVGSVAVEKLAVVANGFSGSERLPQISTTRASEAGISRAEFALPDGYGATLLEMLLERSAA